MRIYFKLLTITQIFAFSLLIQACSSLPERTYSALDTFQDTLAKGGNGPVMVVIPAGEFMMGAEPGVQTFFPWELPSHKVTLSRPFAIGKFELTFQEYDQFVRATGYRKPSDLGWGTKFWGRERTPVFDVTWHDAQQYLAWLSEQTGAHYRLPTEAEWEYAARAGSTAIFSTGNCINTEQANFHDKENFNDCPLTSLYRGKVIETGSFPPNAWGLHDVHGNILEWTQDCWHDNFEGAPTDGSAWTQAMNDDECNRVLRGGSWSGRALELRSAARAQNLSTFKSIFIGFRVVRELN